MTNCVDPVEAAHYEVLPYCGSALFANPFFYDALSFKNNIFLVIMLW